MNINTLVNNNYISNAVDKILTVFIQVESESNFLPQYKLKSINTEEEFYKYFADSKSNYDQSLLTALRLIKNGYNLIVSNVKKSSHKLTARVFNDGHYRYLDDKKDIGVIKARIQGSKNLAVRVNIDNFINNGDYILLEHEIPNSSGRKIASNVIIYLGKIPPVNSINYKSTSNYGLDPSLSKEEKLKKIQSYLTTKESYHVNIDDGELRIAYPYEFVSIYNFKGATIDYDESFECTYLNSIEDDEKCFDIISKYNSNLDEISLEYKYEYNKHVFYVNKLYNEKDISYSERFDDSDLNSAINKLNDLSELVNLNVYSDKLVEGIYYLRNLDKKNYSTTEDDYISSYEKVYNERSGNYHNFCCNFIYESDKFFSKRSQLAMNLAFSELDTPMIRLVNFIDESLFLLGDMVTCFTDNYYKVEEGIYSSKELFLKLLIENKLSNESNEIKLIGEFNSDSPDYVNKFTPEVLGVNICEIKTIFNSNIFNLFDTLIISVFDNLANTESDPLKTKYSLYDIIDRMNDYFNENLGYNPDIKLLTFEYVTDNKIEVSLEYYVKTFKSIQEINLVLNIT